MSSTITALTSGGGLAMAGDTSGQLELKTNNGTTAVTVDTSQNVNVSQAIVLGYSASTKYAVDGTLSNYASNNGVYINGNAGGFLQIAGDGTLASKIAIQGSSAGTPNTIQFSTASTERMRINSAGELLWGCTATSGGIPTTSGLSFAATATAYDNVIYFRNGADPTYVLDFYNAAGSRAGKVTVNASTTSYDTSSDYRLKENVAPMSNALATVALLKPVTYTWKATNEAGQGFIAHELQEILPDAVTGEKDGVDKNGNPDYQGVDASFLVATLTAAIQELKAQVDAQAAEIQALKGVA